MHVVSKRMNDYSIFFKIMKLSMPSSSSSSSSGMVPAPTCLKVTALSFFSLTLLFLGKHISDHHSTSLKYSPLVISPEPAAEIVDTVADPPPPPPPTAGGLVERTGIVDGNGIMTASFLVKEFDKNLVGIILEHDLKQAAVAGEEEEHDQKKTRPIVNKYRICHQEVGNEDDDDDHSLITSNCIVPRPNGYKFRIPWPNSRNQIWARNIPLVGMGSVEEEEDIIDGERKWMISKEKDKFTFPKQDAIQSYLDNISKMVPEIAFGLKTRVILDMCGGVGSFGAFLDDLNVTVISINAAAMTMDNNKTSKKKMIQLVLERGLPAMVTSFSSHRFPFPSQAFDLIHSSSSCLLVDQWTLNDGTWLLEVNRLLRAGGYFVWSSSSIISVNQTHQLQQWKEMEDLTERICWEIMKKENNIVIWQKPLNNSCYLNRDSSVKPQLCDSNDNPDNVWKVDINACITRIPDNNHDPANFSTWPARLHDLPNRLSTVEMDAFVSRKDLLVADKKYWENIVYGYVHVFGVKNLNARNIMDMRSVYGGFAAALHDSGIDCWVMNVVPISGLNTLPIIYDRGLIGVQHDWCEPFDTYPRTYDILNAANLFSIEQKRCDIAKILLEMDRILRPGGRVFIVDIVTVIEEIKEIANAMGWVVMQFNTIEGPHSSFKLMLGEKRL